MTKRPEWTPEQRETVQHMVVFLQREIVDKIANLLEVLEAINTQSPVVQMSELLLLPSSITRRELVALASNDEQQQAIARTTKENLLKLITEVSKNNKLPADFLGLIQYFHLQIDKVLEKTLPNVDLAELQSILTGFQNLISVLSEAFPRRSL